MGRRMKKVENHWFKKELVHSLAENFKSRWIKHIT